MQPNYTTHDPKGWCGDPSRGAAMGRCDYHADDCEAPVKLYVRRIPLDSGGYDRNGTYFGTGNPLYWIATADCSVDFVMRASNREQAKTLTLYTYPNARFFR